MVTTIKCACCEELFDVSVLVQGLCPKCKVEIDEAEVDMLADAEENRKYIEKHGNTLYHENDNDTNKG